ncbi:hypothetical protein RvY_15327 [Ramazzottius varieornatus]|uniref:G-protein coupled receptors family 1 profile domain-containing protein n=1 Tax=Ramazzottius varieornatus TaxID=947166 RepID=A0A1D1VUG8_RAMVA|nr:hypothetical protein RvY_15327 [Ramazzottius varieornatus]
MNNSTCIHIVEEFVCLPRNFYICLTSILCFCNLICQIVNIGILATFFIRRRTLMTPFLQHIVILVFYNTVIFSVYVALTVTRPLVPKLYHSHPLAYSLMVYIGFCMGSLNSLEDCIICLDRWLAFYCPLWYRMRKPRWFAFTGASIAVVYFHAWYLPLGIKAHIARQGGCDSRVPAQNPYYTYSMIVSTVTCIVPETLAYLGFPILLMLVWRHRRGRLVGQASQTSAMNSAGGNRTPAKYRAFRQEKIVSKMVVLQYFLKLSVVVVSVLPTVSVAIRTRTGFGDCKWDVVYLSQDYAALIYILEPFVFLAMLPDVRTEFLNIFVRGRFITSR